jgi:branched-chain amino acid transport system substrate-binding protein
MLKMTGAVLAAGLTFSGPAFAADAPAEIKIGTLYASSGRYASISMPVYSALKLWIDQKNADGGAYVKAFDKKIPVKLVAYDDQSNTATASTLYNQLITQDKVDLLVADSGSVLTAPAVAIARDHKMFLFDQTGTRFSTRPTNSPERRPTHSANSSRSPVRRSRSSTIRAFPPRPPITPSSSITSTTRSRTR